MKKGVLRGLSRAASERARRLQEAAEKTVEGLLETTYVGTAEQALRGAETVTKLLHEQNSEIVEAKHSIAKQPLAKPKPETRPKRGQGKAAGKQATKRKARARSGKKSIKRKGPKSAAGKG